MKNKILLVAAVACLAALNVRAGYCPSTGRWFSRDSISERGGLNLYGFCKENPIGKFDKLGMQAITPGGPNLKFFGSLEHIGTCGYFVYQSGWVLDSQSDASVGGMIVQNVSAKFDVHYCDKNNSPYHFGPPSSNPVDPSAWPFYEAWSIPPGLTRPSQVTAGYNDVFRMPDFGVGTRGSFTITASADYFDGQAIPGYFISNPGGQGPSHSLPTSPYFFPPGTPNSSAPRTVTVSWNCCCKREPNQISIPPSTIYGN